ncbi:WG repeat-containing protein [Fulvivirga sedimenti]|uniref:WG repeat-containing protein n=1 Tax=Fulvivirga sedimenti TaxID=2879465 RepID=A0A9X1HNM5_9BACT|nr:WG repeat-containing protein [Fulvivirga sedimenti]MCA6074138.1 WG repeat-containing protein [Fulvivirga sedimenti]
MRIFLLIFFLYVPALLLSAGAKLTVYTESGREGLKDENGQILIPARYEKVGWSTGDTRVVNDVIGYRENGLWGLISIQDKIRSKPVYRSLIPAGAESIIAALPNPAMRYIPSGVISSEGKILIPFSYLRIQGAGKWFIVESYNNGNIRFGIVDDHHRVVISSHFQQIRFIGENRFAVMNDSGKWAMFDPEGNPLTAFAFDRLEEFQQGYAKASLHRSMGLLDIQGGWKISPEYSSLSIDGSSALATPFAQWDILTEQNQKLHSVAFDSILPWQEEYWKVIANGHEWIVDQDLNPVTPDNYSHIDRLNSELLTYADKDKYGVIFKDGSYLIKANFDTLFSLQSRIYAYAGSGVDRGWSLFDFEGRKLTEFTYQRMQREQSPGLIPVKRNLKWGMMKRDGSESIPCTYDSIGMSIPGKIVVQFRGKWGIIDEDGQWILTPKDGPIRLVNDQFYLQHQGGVTYLKHIEKGTIYFTENPLEVKDGYLIENRGDNAFWKINFSGQILNVSERQEYEEIRVESEGFIAVRMNGRYGFIDLQDRLRIANRYDDVTDFHEGLGGFKLLGKWGFLNKQEGIVIQPRFDGIGKFENGLCIVTDNGKAGVIDIKGNWIIRAEYEQVRHMENGHYLIVKNGKAGLLDSNGRIIVGAKYDELQDLEDGQVIVRNYGKYGLISRKGEDLIPISYDYLLFDPYNRCYLGMKKVDSKTIPLR